MSERKKVCSVVVKTVFPGIHHWKDAPYPVEFLRHPHRHLFVTRVSVKTEIGNDRPVEYFLLQKDIKDSLDVVFSKDPLGEFNFGEASCEVIADVILEGLEKVGYNVQYVSVAEDDENAAFVRVERE